MRLLLIDFETTGLNHELDRITEMGYLLRDTEQKKPLLEFSTMVWDMTYPPISPQITKLTGITKEMLEEFGKTPSEVFAGLDSVCIKHKPNYFVAHNARAFDAKFLHSELMRNDSSGVPESMKTIPWLDTKIDIPFEEEPDSRRLGHLAAAHGFLNPFPHSALADVQTMDRLLSNYKIEDVIAFSSSPDLTVKALVTKERKDLAKFNGFRWDPVTISWTRTIKANKFEEEKQRCIGLGFAIAKM